MIAEKGHDYFLAVTDARPDTGGLSGATPAEAVSWGKIDPDQLPGHGDLLLRLDDRPAAAHRLRAGAARSRARRKRLYERREDLMARLKQAYHEYGRAGEGSAKG